MKSKCKKGFTLIELLAVIVILAIIILIVYPIVTNTINQARYGAFEASKKGIERAAELYYASNADEVVWNDNISYVEIGKLKEKGLLNKRLINLLNNMEISDDTKVLLYKDGNYIKYSLQLYNEEFLRGIKTK